MNARNRTPDRLERIERSVMGLVLMAAVAWAVIGGPNHPDTAPQGFAASSQH